MESLGYFVKHTLNIQTVSIVSIIYLLQITVLWNIVNLDVPLLRRSFHLWKELSKQVENPSDLFHICGALMLGALGICIL